MPWHEWCSPHQVYVPIDGPVPDIARVHAKPSSVRAMLCENATRKATLRGVD